MRLNRDNRSTPRRWGEPLSAARAAHLEHALHRAVQRRNSTAVQTLLLQGADCKPVDSERQSALGTAIENKDLVTACLLLSAGATHGSMTHIDDLVQAGFDSGAVAECRKAVDEARLPSTKALAARPRDSVTGPKVIYVTDCSDSSDSDHESNDGMDNENMPAEDLDYSFLEELIEGMDHDPTSLPDDCGIWAEQRFDETLTQEEITYFDRLCGNATQGSAV